MGISVPEWCHIREIVRRLFRRVIATMSTVFKDIADKPFEIVLRYQVDLFASLHISENSQLGPAPTADLGGWRVLKS